jgi:hypothetical protein
MAFGENLACESPMPPQKQDPSVWIQRHTCSLAVLHFLEGMSASAIACSCPSMYGGIGSGKPHGDQNLRMLKSLVEEWGSVGIELTHILPSRLNHLYLQNLMQYECVQMVVTLYWLGNRTRKNVCTCSVQTQRFGGIRSVHGWLNPQTWDLRMSAINTIDSGSGAIALTFISFLRRPK